MGKLTDLAAQIDAIHAFCIISPADRKAAWAKHDLANQKEDAVAKIGPKEQQQRDLKAARMARGEKAARMTTLRAMVNAVDGPKKTPKASAPVIHEDAVLEVLGEAQQETTMTTKSKTKPAGAKQKKRSVSEAAANLKAGRAATKAAAKAKSKTAATANARTPTKPKEPRGFVVDILKLASRASGVTPAELNELTKWKGAPWKWLFQNPKKNGYCDRFGYTFEVSTNDDKATVYKVTKKS